MQKLCCVRTRQQFSASLVSPPHQLISQPILIHFWWELYHPDEKENLDILEEDNVDKKKAKKEKLAARTAIKKGYRDLVMSTEGISLNIVENAKCDKIK